MSKNFSKNKNGGCLCSKFQEAFCILGKKWNGMIIESLLLGGPLRFGEISVKVENCSDRVLTARLKELQDADILKRKTYSDSSLIKYELTDKGKGLKPIMDKVHVWADEWCDGDK